MDIKLVDNGIQQAQDLYVVGLFEDQKLSGPVAEVNHTLDGVLEASRQSGEFTGAWLKTWDVHTLGKLPARRVLVVGLGQAASFGLRELRMASGQIAQWADERHIAHVVFEVPTGSFSAVEAAEAVTEGFTVGIWQFASYKSTPRTSSLESVMLAGLAEVTAASGITRGEKIASGQNLVRELGFRPSNKLYPELLAAEAVSAGKDHGFSVEVFDEHKLEELGMGALLGVGQGSVHPPRLVVMRYQGGGDRTLALVGKGITFDSGGISLKPPAGMEEMKYDMLGAGAVLGAMCAISDLKLPINVIGLMAVAQNMPSGSAYKPGDVVRAFNGKTIEVTNTDAEGRVALSDAVSYAAHLGVDWIVETSTLTGAAVVVLGHEATALVSYDDALSSLVLQASESVGERVWRLPIYPEYRKLYRSDVADIKNSPGRPAGTITAGMIIAEFVGTTPFAHLDIAGTAWTDKGPLNRTKGGPTGVMVRTFVKLAETLAH